MPRRLAIQIIIHISVFVLSALMLGFFVAKNFDYIANPELSPYYNEGAAFGDGHAEAEFLLTVPVKLSSCLFALDILCFLSCFSHGGVLSQGQRLDKSLLLSALLILILAFVSGQWIAVLPLPVCFAIPVEAAAAIVFLVRRKKIHAASVLILFVQHSIMFSLEMFVCVLYLD